MPTEPERLATLEAESDHIRETLEEVRADVKEIKDRLSAQKGFIAGAAAVATVVWSVVALMVKSLFESGQSGQ